MASTYETAYRRSIDDPEGFWAEAAENLHWYKKWDRVLDDSNTPFYRWFRGGEINTCYNMLDYHVEHGRGDQAALIYDSPVTDTVKTYTYKELRNEVAHFAGAIQSQGVAKGDRVIIYMPMVPQALIAMLACARIGAVHSVVFGGFAAKELATRIDDAKPKLIVSASCGIEGKKIIEYKPLLDQAIELAVHKPDKCITLQRPQVAAGLLDGRDLTWQQALENADPVDCVPVAATDPLYILYTSGTTGIPKGVVRDNGGHAVAMKWSMKNVYGVEAGDVYWAASDIGWVVGHSYIVYAPLLMGCTTILYEGKPVGTPDPGAFWRVISQHNVKVLFTAPTAFRAIKRDDPAARVHQEIRSDQLQDALPRRRTLRSRHAALGRGQTRRARDRPLVANRNRLGHRGQLHRARPANRSNPARPPNPLPGYDVKVLDENGHEVPRGKIGSIVIKLPLPPGCLPTLWNNDQGFKDSYLSEYPGYYTTADAGYQDEDGYLYIMARTDDIINVAGHRLSTGGMEEVLTAHNDVAECAVVGVADQLKGEIPVGFVVLKGRRRPPARRHHQGVDPRPSATRSAPSPPSRPPRWSNVLPKTRSGKILRGTR